MKKLLISILAIMLLSGCGNKTPELPTQDIKALSDKIASTMVASAIKTEMAKPTPTIYLTPTPKSTPTPEPTPTIAVDVLYANKEAGFYLVNVDIAPGVWRSAGRGNNCYWAVTDSKGTTTSNHFGMAGGTAFIPPNAFQVEFNNNCGTWTFLQKP